MKASDRYLEGQHPAREDGSLFGGMVKGYITRSYGVKLNIMGNIPISRAISQGIMGDRTVQWLKHWLGSRGEPAF